MQYKCILILLILSLFSCNTKENQDEPNGYLLDKSSLERHMATLSSDDFQGRMPFTEGETKTVAYLEKELKAMGLQPGNGNSYTQDVPLVEITSTPESKMTIQSNRKTLEFKPLEDFVVHSQLLQDKSILQASDLVFCGFGIVAPEYGWNDFEGVDMKGKTAVVLVNDPGFGGEDESFFKGNIMTYYGRWTYKYEEAARQGADGLLIIHETASAGYPWYVVRSSWTGPQLGLVPEEGAKDTEVKGWISLEAAQKLFEAADMDFGQMVRAARKPGFKAVPMQSKVSVALSNHYKQDVSKNVLGLIEGSTHKDEYIVYTAHWDHIGIGAPIEGDSIYNGALDNASGTSTVLGIAEAFMKLPEPPKRSTVFLFVTAEEQGLLGSAYYAENPIFPLEQTVCNLNMDGVNPIGAMKDLTITGLGHSEMDDIAEEEAKKQGRYILPDQEPEKGYFFRSDHFNFAKKGVPVLYADGGADHIEKGKDFVKKYKEDYTAKRYHQPSDNYDPLTWEYEGMLQDGQLYYNVGLRLANGDEWPLWKEGSEFKSARKKVKD